MSFEGPSSIHGCSTASLFHIASHLFPLSGLHDSHRPLGSLQHLPRLRGLPRIDEKEGSGEYIVQKYGIAATEGTRGHCAGAPMCTSPCELRDVPLCVPLQSFLELLAMELKSEGKYVARGLSYKSVGGWMQIRKMLVCA